MNKVWRRKAAAICATVALGVLSAGHSAMPADQDASEAADQELVERVQAALQGDPYVFNKHIRVSVEKGSVVLQGFVFSDWDLRSALRVATKAAGNKPVINNLSIKASERR